MNDGGPAFPAPDFIVPKDLAEQHIYRLGQVRGMSLRDYFAAAALQGLLACPASGEGTRNDWAKWSYEYADSMLAERARSLTSKE